MNPSPAIQADDLRKRFGDVRAVDGVSLEVRAGEIFGLIGPDGAGKTTMMRMLCGVLRPDGGSATVAGRDVIRRPEDVKRRIGYLSQAFSLYGDLTVEENIDFCADLYLTPRGEVASQKESMLALTDLARFRTRQARRLSGGMKQKLGLICALIHRPEALILDEPTTGVDPISRRDFWRILADLPAQGVTVILSSPYMEEAARCHRLALMHRGKLLATGAASELQERVHGAVIEVVTPEVRAARRVLGGCEGVLSLTPFGDALHVRIDPARTSTERLEAALAGAGLPCLEAHPIEASLEDAFLELVGAEEGA